MNRLSSEASNRRGLVGAWGLIALGAVAAAVGVGTALPHLSKEGISLYAVLTLAVLVTGVALFALGVVVAFRRGGWWARLATGLGALVLLVLSLYVVGQAVAATNVPSTELRDETPGDRGLDHREVEVPTEDGVTLSGWYAPSRNGAAVLLRHGAGSTRSNVLDHAEVLAGHGYGVLLVDARGHGRSGGRAMDFGWYGDDDVRAGVSFLVEQDDVDAGAVGVLGLSMGGEEAVGALAADDRIRAVVAEGVGQRVAEDKEWLVDEYGWRGRVQVWIDHAMYGLTDLLTDAGPPTPMRRAIGGSTAAVLLIAGGDEPSETEVAEHLASASPGRVEVWTVPGAGHTGALDTAPQEWERRVVELFDAALLDGDAVRS